MILLLLLLLDGLVTTVTATCTVLPQIPHAKPVKWIKKGDAYPGIVTCSDGYALKEGLDAIVWCKQGIWTIGNEEKLANACVVDSNSTAGTELIYFRGEWYNYTFIKMPSKTLTFPLIDPSLSYVFITNYTANNATPTIRVRVGLVGKASNPVLVNIQQSTESVGFELPLRVVGKGGSELAPYNTKTVELCPPMLTEEVPNIEETVRVSVKSRQKKGSELKMQLHLTAVKHIDLANRADPHIASVSVTESLIYRYVWTKDVSEVDVYISHYEGDSGHAPGKGADVCAKASIRSGKCPMDEMGVNTMTFTRQGFFTVNRHDKRLKDIKDGFLLVLEVLPDDWECRSNPSASEIGSREKTVKVSIKATTPRAPGVYLAMPIVVSIFLMIGTYLAYVFLIKPMALDSIKNKNLLTIEADDQFLINPTSSALPPFDNQEIGVKQPKQIDIAESCSSDDVPTLDIFAPRIPPSRFDDLKNILNMVKQNEVVVNITQTIGHCAIPLIIFVNLFDSCYDDISGNLKEYTLRGDLDACYVNSKCAFPVNISGYKIPDISRVTSNIPYIASGICFYFLVYQKNLIMKPINDAGRGVKHDFSLFYVLAFITGIIGFASAVYHVCPNQTTSHIDMFFIEILLGYHSLKLYQSRAPDIRSLFYAPGVFISILNIVERLVGMSELSWLIICIGHIVFTLGVATQLFFLGKITMNPITMFKERNTVWETIKLAKQDKKHFACKAIAFSGALAATIGLALTGILELWTNYPMYNVVAIGIDIAIYLTYYLLTKFVIRREKALTHVVVLTVMTAITWLLAVGAFLGFKSIDTSLSAAESRCYNKDCIAGPIDGHDLWHCLSATAILLTNIMVLSLDDDLVGTKTAETYF